MRKFTDINDQTWSLSITIAAAKRVKDLCQIDLLESQSSDDGLPANVRITTEPLLFGQVLYAVLQPAAKHLDLDAFLELFDGATYARAYKAFNEELIDFFRQSGQEHLAKVQESYLKALTASKNLHAAKVASIDIDRLMEREGKRIDANLATILESGNISGSVPDSSVSTPAD